MLSSMDNCALYTTFFWVECSKLGKSVWLFNNQSQFLRHIFTNLVSVMSTKLFQDNPSDTVIAGSMRRHFVTY